VGTVETVLSLSIPGVVLVQVTVAAYELLRQKRDKHRGTPLSTTYLNEFTAMFYGTKRMELDHRTAMSLMREEDAQGAPPGFGVDLDRRVVVLRPGPDQTNRP
jgi:Family of unknown function (DUF6191)